ALFPPPSARTHEIADGSRTSRRAGPSAILSAPLCVPLSVRDGFPRVFRTAACFARSGPLATLCAGPPPVAVSQWTGHVKQQPVLDDPEKRRAAVPRRERPLVLAYLTVTCCRPRSRGPPAEPPRHCPGRTGSRSPPPGRPWPGRPWSA